MSPISEPSDGQLQQDVWLHLPNAKKATRRVMKVTLIPHCTVLDRLSRAAGYNNYNEALHSPRGLSISLDIWAERLSKEFGMPLSEIFSDDEAAVWYSRLFVERGRAAALERGDLQEYRPDELNEDGEDQSIHQMAHHEKTIVDSIRQRR